MLIIIRGALAAIVSVCNLHFFLANYTEIFHDVYKGNVISFQCEVSLDRSASMGKVDGLSLILIDLYVPVPTLRLH